MAASLPLLTRYAKEYFASFVMMGFVRVCRERWRTKFLLARTSLLAQFVISCSAARKGRGRKGCVLLHVRRTLSFLVAPFVSPIFSVFLSLGVRLMPLFSLHGSCPCLLGELRKPRNGGRIRRG